MINISIHPIFLFMFLAIVVLLYINNLKKKAYQRKMIYKMYSVRDEFVFLVAQDKIQDQSKVFNYYYKRINILLQNAPNIGLDDMINQLITSKGSKKLDIEKTKKDVEELNKLKELECEEVRAVVQDYYEVSKEMILAHSSYIRLLYLLFLKSGMLKRYMINFISSDVKKTLSAIHFAKEEADNFKQQI